MPQAGKIEDWGTTKTGSPVKRITLGNGALTASILNYGAILQDLRFEGHDAPLVLGFDAVENYENNQTYFGATVGRCANRVSNGTCEIAGTQYHLERAEGEIHHLHGGPHGFYARCWDIADSSEDSVTLVLESPDGEAGYPGNLTAQCVYSLKSDNTLHITLTAQTDAPTICNLVNHSYFNLEDGGANDVTLHRLQMDAAHYLVSDETNAPTGEIAPVSGTEFDFRAIRPIGDFANYDHNFCLSDTRRELTEIARLTAPSSGLQMDILTTEPGIQFYGGAYLNVADPGLDGIAYIRGSGICLETQIWPDAINFPAFPDAVLMPDETLKQVTEYRFSKPD